MFQGINSFEEVTSKINDPTQRMLFHEEKNQLKFNILEYRNMIFE